MIKTIHTSKLIPALFSTGTIKMQPAESLEDLYDELLEKCMKQGGWLENVESKALIALQAWAFGKMTDREAYNKLDRLDYILWEVL